MTFRGVFKSTPETPRDVTHARQFVSAGLALLTAVVVATPPFHQSDWPAPQRPQIPQASTVLAGSLPLTTAKTLPFALKDWPLPRLVDSPVARRWERANDLPRQLQQTLPFALRDWPLALRPLLPPPEQPPLNIAVIRTVVAVQAPFALLDWPAPRRADSPLARDWSRANDLPRQLQVTLPFAQYDWPVARRLLSAPETLLPNVTAINTVVVTAAPFGFFDWALAKRPSTSSPPETPPINVALYTPVTPPGTPSIETLYYMRHKGKR